jgi:anti-anti-sigma regulatory factor
MLLPENFVIQEIEGWYEEASTHLDVGLTVVLDGSAVQRVDTSGLQCLIAVNKKLKQHGGYIQWSAVSEALVKNAGRIGVAHLLDFPNS